MIEGVAVVCGYGSGDCGRRWFWQWEVIMVVVVVVVIVAGGGHVMRAVGEMGALNAAL